MHQNNADLIRPGCRGGHDQFNWESLRTMKYHDREQYLGQTTVIGYLDKGGKWRKKDWYIKTEGRGAEEISIQDEFQKTKEEDEKRLRIALGLEQPEESKQQMKLTKQEIEVLTKKSKFDIDDEENNQKKGLGSGQMTKQTNNVQPQYLLEAYGVQDSYKLKKEHDDGGCLEKKIKKEKKSKSKSKKEKKDKKNKDEKKQKKEKKEKREKQQERKDK